MHGERPRAPKLVLLVAAVFVFSALVLYKRINFVYDDPCDVLARLPEFADRVNGIPRVVHVQWRNRTFAPGSVQHAAHRSVKRAFPRHEIRVWTDEDLRDLVSTHYPWFLGMYDAYPRNIMRVDASRYFILHKHGGLYMDADVFVYADFWRYLDPDRVSVVESYWKMYEEVQNSVMASKPGNPFFTERVFPILVTRHSAEVADRVVWMTGPKMLTDAAFPSAGAPDGRVYELPCQTFNRGRPNASDTDRFHAFVLSHTGRFKDCGDPDTTECALANHVHTATWLT